MATHTVAMGKSEVKDNEIINLSPNITGVRKLNNGQFIEVSHTGLTDTELDKITQIIRSKIPNEKMLYLSASTDKNKLSIIAKKLGLM